MASDNLYADLNDLAFDEKLAKLQDENKQLFDYTKALENDISKLCKELTQMKEKESGLKRNISELFNTAKLESERKDRIINDLESKIDGFIFNRRNRTTIKPSRNSYHKSNNKRSRDDDIIAVFPLKKAKLEDKPELGRARNYRFRSRDHTGSKSIDRVQNRHRVEERTSSVERDKYRHHSRERSRQSSRSDRNLREKGKSKERNIKIERNENPDVKIVNYIGDNLKIEIKNERIISDSEENLSLKKKVSKSRPSRDTEKPKESKCEESDLPMLLSNKIESIKTKIINEENNQDFRISTKSSIKDTEKTAKIKIQSNILLNQNKPEDRILYNKATIKEHTDMKETSERKLCSKPIGPKNEKPEVLQPEKQSTNISLKEHDEDIKSQLNINSILYNKTTIKEHTDMKEKSESKLCSNSIGPKNEKPEGLQPEKQPTNISLKKHEDIKSSNLPNLGLHDDTIYNEIKPEFPSFNNNLKIIENVTDKSVNTLKVVNTVTSSDVKETLTEHKSCVTDQGVNKNASSSRRRRCVMKIVN